MGRRRRFRRDVVPAADIIARKMRSMPQPPAAAAFDDATTRWPALAGELGEGSRPVGLSRTGILTVTCRSAAQAQRLSSESDRLLDAFEGPEVRKVRFVVSGAPPGGAPDSSSEVDADPTPTPRPRHRVAARDATKGVADPTLRGLLERAAATSFAKADSPANEPKERSSRDRG